MEDECELKKHTELKSYKVRTSYILCYIPCMYAIYIYIYIYIYIKHIYIYIYVYIKTGSPTIKKKCCAEKLIESIE